MSLMDMAAGPIGKPFSAEELESLRKWAEVGVKVFDAPDAKIILRLIEEVHFSNTRVRLESDAIEHTVAVLVEAAGGEIVVDQNLRRLSAYSDELTVVRYEDAQTNSLHYKTVRAEQPKES